jgi:hypothetical protein
MRVRVRAPAPMQALCCQPLSVRDRLSPCDPRTHAEQPCTSPWSTNASARLLAMNTPSAPYRFKQDVRGTPGVEVGHSVRPHCARSDMHFHPNPHRIVATMGAPYLDIPTQFTLLPNPVHCVVVTVGRFRALIASCVCAYAARAANARWRASNSASLDCSSRAVIR